ncbi:MAG TPA: hypothetical protein PKO06_21205, partial [Candidatus Ozemobacteraceae bacterium]|nr:hypothetical protein [Candidatus Ozemobacteraceae bacterium]
TAFQQYQNRQYDAAATAFAQVCQAVPTHHQARQYLAWSLLMAGKTDLARPHVEYLYKLDARNAEYVKLYAAVNTPAASAVQSAGAVQWPVWLEKTARLIETISEPGDRSMARFDVLLGLNAHPADSSVAERWFVETLKILEGEKSLTREMRYAVYTVGSRLLSSRKWSQAERLASFLLARMESADEDERRRCREFAVESLCLNGSIAQAEQLATTSGLAGALAAARVKVARDAGRLQEAAQLAQAIPPGQQSITLLIDICQRLCRTGQFALVSQLVTGFRKDQRESLAFYVLSELAKLNQTPPEQAAIEKLITTPMWQCRLLCLKARQAHLAQNQSARESFLNKALQLAKENKLTKAPQPVGVLLIECGRASEAMALLPQVDVTDKLWTLLAWMSPLIERGETVWLQKILRESADLFMLERSTLLEEMLRALPPDLLLALQKDLVSAVSPEMRFQIDRHVAAALVLKGRVSEALPALLKSLETIRKDSPEVQAKVVTDFLSATGTRDLANTSEVL